ncbi:hypothetical protein PG614_06040 [Riemerella anatipestifer]|nr:hypothetical protein [Riemerella anatipestifer]MDY3533028.1 hypothetical protein [Riemerella anatipestifer]MDY3535501.1 hypothetical protein [Riemerella anatipestifer]
MKKLLLFAFPSIVCAQVGINTSSPQETLDVNGTVRVRSLPISGKGNIYNGQAAATTLFNGVNTVISNSDGVIGYIQGLPISYAKNTCLIDNNTPTNSITTLGNLRVRYNSTTASGEQPIW